MANSAPVTIASNQSAVPVSISGNQAINIAQIAGTTISTGNGTTDAGTQRVSISSDSTGLIFSKLKDASGNNTSVQTVGDAMAAAPTTTLGVASFGLVYNGTNFQRQRSIINATDSTGIGIAATGILAQLDDTSPTSITENQFGNVRMAADRSLLTATRATTPSQSSVASSASNVTLLAASNSRKGATITNDSSAVLYIKLGATASTTSYTVTLAGSASAPFAYYEVPFGYVGIIDGIWASATGNARITELT